MAKKKLAAPKRKATLAKDKREAKQKGHQSAARKAARKNAPVPSAPTASPSLAAAVFIRSMNIQGS
jgi:hypothetical protein